MVVWETDNVIGQNITLESPEGGGWWSEEALVILNSMAAQQGVIYVLMWENTQTRCIFNNSDGPATELSKLNPWSGYHVGTLRLITARTSAETSNRQGLLPLQKGVYLPDQHHWR